MKKAYIFLMALLVMSFSVSAFELQSLSETSTTSGDATVSSGPYGIIGGTDCSCVYGSWEVTGSVPPCLTEGLAKWCINRLNLGFGF